MVVGGRELIDTLWNVNFFKKIIDNTIAVELIDTLWNVNSIGTTATDFDGKGINRYIMECKYVCLKS